MPPLFHSLRMYSLKQYSVVPCLRTEHFNTSEVYEKTCYSSEPASPPWGTSWENTFASLFFCFPLIQFFSYNSSLIFLCFFPFFNLKKKANIVKCKFLLCHCLWEEHLWLLNQDFLGCCFFQWIAPWPVCISGQLDSLFVLVVPGVTEFFILWIDRHIRKPVVAGSPWCCF